VITGGEGIPGAGAKPRHDEEIVRTVGKQCGHRGAALEHYFTHTLRPISFCDSSTAAARSSPNASCSAFCTAGTTPSGVSTLATCVSQSFNVGSTIEPIGTCHGLNSSHSPRIVTSISIGKRQARISDSMFTQLPTPLDCISNAER